MTLPDFFELNVGTQLVFADHAADFSGGAAKTSLEVAGTDVQLDLTGLVDGSGRESAKFDLGADFHYVYGLMASYELAATPTTGEVIEHVIAPSPISAAANGNVMSIDGVDAAAPSGIGTLAELVAASIPVGNFKCTNDATPAVQTGFVGVYVPLFRYGIMIVKNESGADFHSDAVESHLVMVPIRRVQNAT